jgi:uncharacterized membrane protein YcaP (DUF421 family)
MDLAIRAIVMFVFLFAITRVVGRRELSSLEPFDLILLIVAGDALQQGLTQDDYSVTGAIIVVSVIALMQVFLSYVNFKFPRVRPLLDGEPIVVVQDGKAIDRNLRRERMTSDDLAEAAREQGIPSLDDVQWAVMETTGRISFIKKSDA